MVAILGWIMPEPWQLRQLYVLAADERLESDFLGL
jgi:hypothetical protein